MTRDDLRIGEQVMEPYKIPHPQAAIARCFALEGSVQRNGWRGRGGIPPIRVFVPMSSIISGQ